MVVEERHGRARLVGQPQVELEVEAADELAQVLVRRATSGMCAARWHEMKQRRETDFQARRAV